MDTRELTREKDDSSLKIVAFTPTCPAGRGLRPYRAVLREKPGTLVVHFEAMDELGGHWHGDYFHWGGPYNTPYKTRLEALEKAMIEFLQRGWHVREDITHLRLESQ